MLVNRTNSFFISLLLIISTTGITIDKHYHLDQLHSISLFGEAQSCCNGPCECCHNEKETIKVENDFVSSSVFVSDDVNLQLFTLIIAESILAIEDQEIKNKIWFQNKPPSFVLKKFILLETFLI